MLLESVMSASGIERATLRALAERGCILIEPATGTDAEVHTSGRQVTLTAEQTRGWETIRAALRSGQAADQILLHGVTGSGKTELYLRTVADVLRRGKSAIMLVPEIALSGQIAARFRERFGDRAIVLHSALHDRERSRNWQRTASGEPVVVVGPRSALFAPLPDIGAIILDEEHDASYKQDSVPRYHARAVATRLAELHGALLILGSATPDVETWHASASGGSTRVELHERVGQTVVGDDGTIVARSIPLPTADIVDMRAELRSGNDAIFSRRLTDVIISRLEAHEQVILFLNRRGASTMVQCRSCGSVSQCPYCDIPLVYHRTVGRVLCHRCGYRETAPQRCQTCGSDAVSYYGTGTQRVETEIQRAFPDARVLRWDQDALRGNVTHETLLGRVMRHEVDIIVGTQMVAKGLDLPAVTAVGVINTDTWLYLPDIRSAERTFQMLTQVAGRAGRRAAGGRVVFQTYSPAHYAITSAAEHAYSAFYREEIAFRQRHGYPPFKRLARLLVRHSDESRARGEAEGMARQLEDLLLANPALQGLDVIGPAPAFSARVRGQYGWQILLRGGQLVAALAGLQFHPGWAVDVDPVSLL
jgi:primosomal protein N' (replication factor Y)